MRSIIKHLLLLALLFQGVALAADDEETPLYAVNDDMDMISTVQYDYDKPKIVMKSIYPQLIGSGDPYGVDDFNRMVLNLVQEEITAFKQQVAQHQTAALPPSSHRLYIDYDAAIIRSANEPIISIRFSIQGMVAGMAHPYHYHRVLNYDLNDDRQMELVDLFQPHTTYLLTLSQYASHLLFKRFKTNAGTVDQMENYKNWNIKPDGLLITFDPYQVAVDMDETQTVFIPFSILKPLMASDSTLAACIKYPQRCTQHSLLTGGFID